jgi:hypothetical protein
MSLAKAWNRCPGARQARRVPNPRGTTQTRREGHVALAMPPRSRKKHSLVSPPLGRAGSAWLTEMARETSAIAAREGTSEADLRRRAADTHCRAHQMLKYEYSARAVQGRGKKEDSSLAVCLLDCCVALCFAQGGRVKALQSLGQETHVLH